MSLNWWLHPGINDTPRFHVQPLPAFHFAICRTLVSCGRLSIVVEVEA